MSTENDYRKIVDSLKMEVLENLADLKPAMQKKNRTPAQQSYIEGFNEALVCVANAISRLQQNHSIDYRIEQLLKELGIDETK